MAQGSRGYLGDPAPPSAAPRGSLTEYAGQELVFVRVGPKRESTVSLGAGRWGKHKGKGLQASQNAVLQDPGRLPPHFQLNTLRSGRP